jgi:hypothetical protein
LEIWAVRTGGGQGALRESSQLESAAECRAVSECGEATPGVKKGATGRSRGNDRAAHTGLMQTESPHCKGSWQSTQRRTVLVLGQCSPDHRVIILKQVLKPAIPPKNQFPLASLLCSQGDCDCPQRRDRFSCTHFVQ